ncbi:hypothetical protein [Micromonospora sp. NPDC047740]|uniref:hypothetical protein n=1 Tax=Micromonospora sp. NPDC047740 TaxID=3364254 RepID=UPI003720B7CA
MSMRLVTSVGHTYSEMPCTATVAEEVFDEARTVHEYERPTPELVGAHPTPPPVIG